MEGESSRGRASASLIDELTTTAPRFEFFQAVRIVERWLVEREKNEGLSRREPVGHDHPVSKEAVRFRGEASLRFPENALVDVDERKAGYDVAGEEILAYDMRVAFYGLFGPGGVLPAHYTSLVIERLRQGDTVLRDFLDLFNHRAISLFYRAWEKYRFPVSYERVRNSPRQLDPAAHCEFLKILYSVVGRRDAEARRGRGHIDPEAWIYYGGYFAHYPRNASSLAAMLGDYFGFPVTIEQFRDRWIVLDENSRSLMPTAENPDGQNCRLGVDMMIGSKVRDVQGAFRIRLGPMSLAEFKEMTPDGETTPALYEMTRAYVGCEFDFDVQPVLSADEIPRCSLESEDYAGVQLGYTTWLTSEQPTEDFAGTAFSIDDFATERSISNDLNRLESNDLNRTT